MLRPLVHLYRRQLNAYANVAGLGKVDSLFVNPCMAVMLIFSQAWYLYEYLLTISLEVKVIWKSKISVATILFLVNRYVFIIFWVSHILWSVLTIGSSKVGWNMHYVS